MEIEGIQQESVQIPINDITLEGMLALPSERKGLIIFAHGSGSSRFSVRNQYVSQILRSSGFGTLLFDLLTPEQDEHYSNRFDIELLTDHLVAATRWIMAEYRERFTSIGYFGASTGSAAAIMAAVELNREISAVVSRGGRPDLAGKALTLIDCPILLIVGSEDAGVIELNESAYDQINTEKEITLIPHATHLFEGPGQLEQVAFEANHWFSRYLI